MKKVQIVSGTGLPLRRSDVDTDQIIPAEWLKKIERTGFEKGLFSTWRDDRRFVMNDERFLGASILVAGKSFGVGSSREHAVWAIIQGGFDAVIAPSFSDIFRNNCSKNGLVLVEQDEATIHRLWEAIEDDPKMVIVIDVNTLVLEVPSISIHQQFKMDPDTRARFLHGLDDISISLANEDSITRFELSRPEWLTGKKTN